MKFLGVFLVAVMAAFASADDCVGGMYIHFENCFFLFLGAD